MFVLGDEEKDKEVFALRPMTCPFQYQAYLNRKRSYSRPAAALQRDLHTVP